MRSDYIEKVRALRRFMDDKDLLLEPPPDMTMDEVQDAIDHLDGVRIKSSLED